MNSVKRFAFVATVMLLGAIVSAAPASATSQPCTGGSALNGWYGLLVGSYAGSGGKYLVGALNFDGACGLTGTNTFGGNGGAFVTSSVTGTYVANPDGTIGITMSFAGQSTAQTYIVGVSQSGNEAVGIETDGTSAFIDLQSQLTTLSNGFNMASLSGTYAASCIGSGVDLNYATFSFDGSGNISGVDSEQNNGGVTTDTPYTGTYTVNTDGTFQGSVLFNGANIPFYGVVDNGNNEIEYIYTGVNACVGKSSTSTSLSGTYGVLVSGTSTTSGNEKFLSGAINFTNSGTLSGEVNGGINGSYGNSSVTGSWVVKSDDTVAITMNLAGQSTPQTYSVGVGEAGNEVIGVETDNTATATIDMQAQLTTQPYSASSLSGTYAVVCSNIGIVALNYVTFDGLGNLSGALAYSDGGNYSGDSAYNGTYSVNSDGTFQGSLGGGLAGYSFNGVIDNATAEIAYTYVVGGAGNQACSGVSTYGPVGASPVAATPTFNPAPGAYNSAQSIMLSDTTPGAVIHYTTNGTPPTANSPVYSSPIPASSTISVEAIAVAPNHSNSAIGTGTYFVTVLPSASAPAFNPLPGTYNSAVSVGLTDTTPGTVIYYTTNGTPPSQGSAVYSTPIPISATTTIEAIAVASGYSNSAPTIGTYTINLPTATTPTFNPPPGTYSSAQSVGLIDTTPGAVIYYTTNGSTPGVGSSVYSTPIPVSTTTTIQAVAIAPGYNNSPVTSGTYTISSSSGTVVNLSSYYNVYGIATVGSIPKSGGFDNDSYAYNSSLIGTSLTYQGLAFPLGAPNSVDAITGQTVQLGGQYNQLFLLGTAVNGSQANQTIIVTYSDGSTSSFTQNFSDWANPQHFTGETTVTLSTNRISPNGQTQTLNVNVYGYTFNLASGKSLQTVKLPYNRNVVFLGIGLGNPTKLPTVATPTFSLTPGTYNSSVPVTVSDATAGAVVHCTIDGSMATANSPVCGTLQLNATTTIQAIAVANGYNNSAVATAAYTIVGTTITPYLQVNGANWQQTATATVGYGSSVNLGPQPVSGGSWSWTGPNGYTSTARQINNIPLTTGINVFVATYTNAGGVKSTQTFTITVVGTPIVPYIQVNGGAWQQTASVTVRWGSWVTLGPQPASGGSWSWTGPFGFTSRSRQIFGIAAWKGTYTFVATYTDPTGAQTSQAFTITVN